MSPAFYPILFKRKLVGGRYVPCIVPNGVSVSENKVKEILKAKKLWDGETDLCNNYIPEKTWEEILNSSTITGK